MSHAMSGLHLSRLMKGDKNGEDPRQHGDGEQREKGKELVGRNGVRYKLQHLTELVGRIVLRPYVPHGTGVAGPKIILF